MSNKKESLQNDFQRLEEISKELENQDLDVEKSLKLFEEGSKLVKRCHKKLGEAKNRFQEIKEDLEKETE
ncbi:MAG: exodeoxyribonuclease VII small subunit [Candidatus Moranbacteria bacterium]|nr:exodeoxyribonuclease VII small subunit [Candidatus Moranbacteria bacterium]